MSIKINPESSWREPSDLKKAAITVHSLTDSAGRKIVSNDEIANQFVKYYTHLYNPDPQTEDAPRSQVIKDFRKKYKPLSNMEAKELDRPLSSEEVDSALKQLKVGKSLGRDSLTGGYYKTCTD